MNFEYKIDHIHISYTKIAKLSYIVLNPVQNIANVLGQFFLQFSNYSNILKMLNDHASKIKDRKNWKMDYTFVSEHCATF